MTIANGSIGFELFNQKKKQETQNENKSETKPSHDQPDNNDKSPEQTDKEKQSEEKKETKKEEKNEEVTKKEEKNEQEKEEESNEKEESKEKKGESVGRYGEPPRLSTILLGVGTMFLIYYYTDIKVGQPFLTWDQFVLDVRNNVSIFTQPNTHTKEYRSYRSWK